MVRSRWIGAVLAILASLTPAIGQMVPDKIITIREGDKPARKCRVTKCWKQDDGSKVCQVQALDNGEMMTIVDPTATQGKSQSSLSKIFHWGKSDKPPVGVPLPPEAQVKKDGPSLATRLFGARSTPRKAVVPLPDSSPAPVVTTSISAAQSADMRQSWGKLERWSEEDVKKANKQSTVKASFASSSSTDKKADSPGKSEESSGSPMPAGSSSVPAVQTSTASDGKTPCVACQPCGPCKNCCDKCLTPKASSPSMVERLFRKSSDSSRVVQTRSAVKQSTEPPADEPMPIVKHEKPARSSRVVKSSEGSTTRGGLFAALRGDSHPAGKKATGDSLPTGMGSIVAAGTTPVPPVVSAASVPVEAPNAFTMGTAPGTVVPHRPSMGGYPSMPAAVVMTPDVPGAMGNAFTNAGTTRPIPSDMGMHPQLANAFLTGGGMPGANMRPSAQQVMMQQMAMQQAMMAQYQAAMQQAQAQAMAYGPSPALHLNVLRNSILPSDREMAVEQLSQVHYRQQPEVIEALCHAARSDPAPLVRVSCVRALGKMKVNTLPVVTTIQTLKTDGDVRVRHAAEQTLGSMGK